jgi:hypothetical protein
MKCQGCWKFRSAETCSSSGSTVRWWGNCGGGDICIGEDDKLMSILQMNKIEFANTVIEILNREKLSGKFFKDDIDWLNQRIQYWNEGKIKIGIIGITSSGKSTLVNAFIGHDVLPANVAPTSNVLVSAEKGNKFSTLITFTNKKSKKMKLSKVRLAKKKLKEYADEKKNIFNEKGVEMIDIISDKFIPNDNGLRILDSPGLNAYNLEYHEKLSLDKLIYEIEICIFLTTVKPTNHQVEKDILNKIEESNKNYLKQILIVQNKIDVIKEKKEKISGEIKITKTREEVLLDYKRLLLKKCEGIQPIPIISQISSIYALNGRLGKDKNLYEKSQFPEFLNELEKIVKNETLNNNIKSINQIENRLKEIIKRIHIKKRFLKKEFGDIKNEELTNQKKRNSYNNIVKEKNELEIFINDSFDKIDNNVKKQKDNISNLNVNEIDKSKSILNNLRTFVNHSREEIISSLKIFNERCDKFLLDLNENPNEINNELVNIENITINTIEPKTVAYIESKPRKVGVERIRKKGLLNMFARGFGIIIPGKHDWGYEIEHKYETVSEKKTKINIEKTIEVIDIATYRILEGDEKVINNWFSKFEKLLNKIDDTLILKENQIEKDKKSNISQELLDNIEIEIKRLLDDKVREDLSIEEGKDINIDNNKKSAILSLDFKNYAIPEYLLSLYKLSLLKKQYIFSQIWDSIIKNYKTKVSNFKIILILGWNAEAIIEFSNLFIYENGIDVSKFKSKGYFEESINGIKHIYIDRNYQLNEITNKKLIESTDNKEIVLFPLINISNVGETKKLYYEDKLFKEIIQKNENPVNWIYESFQEELNSDKIVDATREFLNFPISLEIYNNGYFLINHFNPIYTLLFRYYKKIVNEANSLETQTKISKVLSSSILNEKDKKNLSEICKIFQQINKNLNNNGN